MAFAGLGWLTFLSPPLASRLSPYNLVLGFVAELLLMLWLLVRGVNVQRWREWGAEQNHEGWGSLSRHSADNKKHKVCRPPIFQLLPTKHSVRASQWH